jgi:N-acetylglutamate synthase/N-acetylornithine aminotransferase
MSRTEAESVRTESEPSAETAATTRGAALISPAMDFLLLFLVTVAAALSVVVLF